MIQQPKVIKNAKIIRTKSVTIKCLKASCKLSQSLKQTKISFQS